MHRCAIALLLTMAQAGAAQSVLDTVRIRAARVDDNRAGFEERRRSGVGRYLSDADIAKRQLTRTSELFSSLPGLRLDPVGGLIRQRGVFEDECFPSVFVNGLFMTNTLSMDDIDNMMSPAEILGIEIYQVGTVPAQFQRGMTGCGSIVFWTKPHDSRSERRRGKGRWIAAAVAIGAIVGLARLVGPD